VAIASSRGSSNPDRHNLRRRLCLILGWTIWTIRMPSCRSIILGERGMISIPRRCCSLCRYYLGHRHCRPLGADTKSTGRSLQVMAQSAVDKIPPGPKLGRLDRYQKELSKITHAKNVPLNGPRRINVAGAAIKAVGQYGRSFL
jgi:hypothetical protein